MRSISLVDVDGVLCDFLNPCLAELSIISGVRYSTDMLRTHDLFDDLGVPHLKSETYRRCGRPGWCRNLPVLDGALDGVEALRIVSKVLFVTSPLSTPTWCYERMAWLVSNFKARRDEVIFTSAKEFVAGDLLVDDHTGHCVRWSKMHQDGVALRWRSPNNAGEEYDGMTTASWEQAVRTQTDSRFGRSTNRSWTI